MLTDAERQQRRAQLQARAQARQPNQSQPQPQSQQSQPQSRPSAPANGNNNSQQNRSSGGGLKHFFAGALAMLTAGALWFGGQKHGEAKAGLAKTDAEANNQTTMNQMVDQSAIDNHMPAEMTEVDWPQLDEPQQEEATAIEPEPEPTNPAPVVEPTPEPVNVTPMTLDERIRTLELMRDQQIRKCSETGDFDGIITAETKFDLCSKVLRGEPIPANLQELAGDAAGLAATAADISGSAKTIVANQREMQDDLARMGTVDPAARAEDVARHRAYQAGYENEEARYKGDTARVQALSKASTLIGTLQAAEQIFHEGTGSVQEIHAFWNALDDFIH